MVAQNQSPVEDEVIVSLRLMEQYICPPCNLAWNYYLGGRAYRITIPFAIGLLKTQHWLAHGHLRSSGYCLRINRPLCLDQSELSKWLYTQAKGLLLWLL